MRHLFHPLLALSCFVFLSMTQAFPEETFQQRLDRLQATISAHKKNHIVNQEIVLHFKEGESDLRTESRDVGIDGSVVTSSQTSRNGIEPPVFHHLPLILLHPLHRLPLPPAPGEEYPEEKSLKTRFRPLRMEAVNEIRYEVIEVTQQLTPENMMECADSGFLATKIVCKLYIGSDGLIERKAGTIFYRDPEAKGKKKQQEQRATFESTRIAYRDAPIENPPAKTSRN